MKNVDFLIIGGSAAGTTAADIVRSLMPDASITIVSDENHEQYSRVLLPHYTRRRIERGQVFLKKPGWYEQRNIDLAKGVKATKLESDDHIVGCDNGEQYKFKKLLLAIGGDVIKLNVPGADLKNVLYMRTIEDGDQIIECASKAQKAIAVGGGFVSLDFVTSFKANGVEDITILVKDPYYWAGKLDEQSSKTIQNVLVKNGIKIVTEEETQEIISGTQGIASGLVTKKGNNFDADIIGVGIGIRSDLSWLQDSGIKIDKSIVTNEYLQTNLPDVFAAGDCAQFMDVVFGLSHLVGTWANATSQGAVVAKNMVNSFSGGKVGEKSVYETASSYSDTFFEGSYTFIGMTSQDYADEIITRGSVNLGKVSRIFIKNFEGTTRIVGASVINNTPEVPVLTRAVKEKINVKSFKQNLGDVTFELSKIHG